MPVAPIPPKNHSTGLSAPFQLISKSNSSPQRTLQALEFYYVDGSTDQAPVVRKADSAIHRINHYPADSVVCLVNTYPLDSDLSGG